ncbi:acyltransferase [Catenovulum maritimum]|uniref:Acetyltransferase n=1 Tax=Catenovulum maritimum TaxID=1513271 RepID=A0A0J8GVP4_9ALTE|nr:acyltransferase [Catenovulum maritimum]KMT64743.1 hypothetical protein XM47_12855 [Catenovulum maritimum]
MIRLIRFIRVKYIRALQFIWRFKVKWLAKKCGSKIYVGNSSTVNKNTELGNYFSTNGLVVRGEGCVSFGDYVHTGQELLVITSNHNFKTATILPYDDTHELKNIIVEDAVWIGDRVTIIGNVVIGEGAIIQAGSVVVTDIPKLAIAGGNPAKVFKYRDENHYFELKSENKFLTF